MDKKRFVFLRKVGSGLLEFFYKPVNWFISLFYLRARKNEASIESEKPKLQNKLGMQSEPRELNTTHSVCLIHAGSVYSNALYAEESRGFIPTLLRASSLYLNGINVVTGERVVQSRYNGHQSILIRSIIEQDMRNEQPAAIIPEERYCVDIMENIFKSVSSHCRQNIKDEMACHMIDNYGVLIFSALYYVLPFYTHSHYWYESQKQFCSYTFHNFTGLNLSEEDRAPGIIRQFARIIECRGSGKERIIYQAYKRSFCSRIILGKVLSRASRKTKRSSSTKCIFS